MLGNNMPSNYTENIRAGLLPQEKISWVIKLSVKSGEVIRGARTACFGIIGHQMRN
jgi:hypothetical protein